VEGAAAEQVQMNMENGPARGHGHGNFAQ